MKHLPAIEPQFFDDTVTSKKCSNCGRWSDGVTGWSGVLPKGMAQ